MLPLMSMVCIFRVWYVYLFVSAIPRTINILSM
jgi:hypothetical protein